MLRHSFLLIYRNFRRFRSTFFINLIGLSAGLAATLLIYLWVRDELKIDKFHEKDDRLFQVMKNTPEPDGIETDEYTPGPLAYALQEEMPEIEHAVSVFPPSGFTLKGILSAGGTHVKANGKFGSKDYFTIFSYPVVKGSTNELMTDKNGVVISKDLAITLFTTPENALGKTVAWNQERFSGVFFVSGVYDNIPATASIHVDILFNYDLCLEKFPPFKEWTNNGPSTYLVLKEGTHPESFQAKISGFLKSKHEPSTSTLFIRKYSDQYLYGRYENGMQAGGRIQYVKLFLTIALFILGIACINFMNLSTAKASSRIKEVGIKKVIGASRNTLIFQYLLESMLMSFIALVLAILLVDLFLPQFNTITGKQLSLDFNSSIIPALSVITLMTGIFSGSYPALYLSGFNPANVLKGKLNTVIREIWIRKGLVIFQFAIAVIFIVCVLVVYKQLEFIHSKNLGFDKDNIIHFSKEGKLAENPAPFITALTNTPGVVMVSSIGGNTITAPSGHTSAVLWEGKVPGVQLEFANLEVGYDLVEMFGYELKEGRTFSRNFNQEDSKIIFNEMAVESMGLTDPLGKKVTLWDKEYQIIGILNNFHFESLYEKVKPCFFRLTANARNIVVKIKAGQERETLDRLEKLHRQYNLGLPLEYKFLDEAYQALYTSEKRVAILSRYFAIIAILISCLGLFGLASFSAERRIKEIGIRKVLGSSVFGILYLLSSDFTKLLFIAIVIGIPVSYWATAFWLDTFAYKINLDWWYFAGAGLLALVIAWLTIGSQALKAARVNPSHCLKEE